MAKPPDTPTRVWRVTLDGVDCYVRTTSRSRARYLAARGFHEAGYGSVGRGLALVTSQKLHKEHERGKEGSWTADGLRSTAAPGEAP